LADRPAPLENQTQSGIKQLNTQLRKRHLRIWILLAPLLIVGVIAAIIFRPPNLQFQSETTTNPGAQP
jgi:hypothetical protein